jgi:endonuclease YncB( thermonuclease family)
MPSEDRLTMRSLQGKPDKLRRKQIKESDQYDEDKQDTFGDNTLYKAIGIGLMIGAGVALYKRGTLKPIVQPLMEATHGLAESSSGQFIAKYGAIREWANLELAKPTNAVKNTNKYTTFKNSIFRTDSESNPYKMLQVLKETWENKDFSSFKSGKARSIINDTSEDLKDLVKRINQHTKNLSERTRSLHDTDILRHMNEINEAVTMSAHNTGKGTIGLRSEFAREFYRMHKVDEKKAAQQLKESGFRSLILGDIFEEVRDENGNISFKAKEGAEKFLNIFGDDKSSQSFADEIYKNLTKNGGNLKFVEDGQVKAMFGKNPNEGFWKDLVIDDRIMTNGLTGDKMQIINSMASREGISMVWDSLKNDFKLPIVGFNPIKSFSNFMGPVDEWLTNRREPSFAWADGNAFMSAFTGEAGKKSVRSWAVENFGESYKNADIFYMNGNAFLNDENGKLHKIADNIKVYDITNRNKAYSLQWKVNAMRQMAGLTTTGDNAFDVNKSWEQYMAEHDVQDTMWNKFKYNVLFRGLHIGASEPMLKEDKQKGFDESTNIDEWMSDFIGDKIVESDLFKTVGHEFSSHEEMAEAMKQKSYADAMGIIDSSFINNNGTKIHPRQFVFTKRGYNVGDVVKAAKEHGFKSEEFMENFKGLVGQYGSGFDSNGIAGKYMTENSTGGLWRMANILDQGLDSIHLGLAPQDKRNGWSYIGNLLLRRALPAYMLMQAPGMIEWMSEPFFTDIDKKKHKDDDKYDERPHNITQWITNHVVRPIDIRAHQLMDITGVTKFFKGAKEYVPGWDQINELPGIYHLGLGQTTAEREEYIISGYDPIRKGRYWSSGNTPFTGGKIEYWRPNLYRRINADVKFSGSKFGSRQEYYDNTWYPNVVNPLAPLNHFILDRHHWDKKHYYDRPYLVHSGDALTQMPWIGPLFDAIERPFQGKMHKEYWDHGRPIIKQNDEAPDKMLLRGESDRNVGIRIKQIFKNVKDGTYINIISNKQQALYDQATVSEQKERLSKDIKSFSEMLNNMAWQSKLILDKQIARDKENRQMQYTDLISYGSLSGSSTQKAELSSGLSSSTLPIRDYDRYGTPLEVYSTPSGRMKIVDVPDNLNLYKVNEELKHFSINKIYGTNQRIDISDYSYPGMPVGNDNPKIDNYFKYSLGETYEQLGDVFGLRGFIAQQFITGKANQQGAVIESSGYSYSSANDFWNQNLGGFGGELSEIARRFIPQKNKHIEYINPIRNTQPQWMPGRNYFIDFLHGDPYTKVANGEERIAGEGYERLNNINLSLNVDISQIGKSRQELVKHFLHQDEDKTWDERQEEKKLAKTTDILNEFDAKGIAYRKRQRKRKKIASAYNGDYNTSLRKMADDLVDFIHGYGRGHEAADRVRGNINDKRNNITGKYDAIMTDMKSPTGKANMMIKPVTHETFNRLSRNRSVRQEDYSQLNYQMWATSNGRNIGYIRYIDSDTGKQYERRVGFNKLRLQKDLNALYDARMDINNALKKGTIGRGELYPLLDRFRILADVAPYSQEYKDVAAKIAQAKLSESEKEEAKRIRERAKEQKKPLRIYNYKFQTAKTKKETVHVRRVIDNNTFITEEYGTQHAVRFAGIRVSESSSDLYKPHEEKYRDKGGRRRVHDVSKYSKKEAAERTINRYLKPGQKIEIEYDADSNNKFSNDSTRSIRAVVHTKGKNLNRQLINMGLAKEKEDDDSPAAIRARYSSGQIAFGSAMESLTHKGVAMVPFIGQKVMQVRSPYESYREREVYGKDFQSWNHPIRDIFLPNMVDRPIADHRLGGLFPVIVGGFIGSMFGRSGFGKMVGTAVGAGIPLIGKGIVAATHHDKKQEWRPKRRREQEDINTYMDMLKYIKNMRLYNQYAEKSKKEDKFDVKKYENEEKAKGEFLKQRSKELDDYKRIVKLDFKHHRNYNFKYGQPKYVEKGMDRKSVISAINKEKNEIQSNRKVEKVPMNAIKAIAYKQEAQKTMYAYEPGSDLSQFMAALPKKDRQYFKYFVDAPAAEKDKILRIAPKYMRRALEFSWGRDVEAKESVEDYFTKHALPDESWEGWREDANLDDVKVKMVNKLKQDPGEFNIWDADKQRASQVNIPIPRLNKVNNFAEVSSQLKTILGKLGYEDIQITTTGNGNGNIVDMQVAKDEKDDVEEKIKRMRV